MEAARLQHRLPAAVVRLHRTGASARAVRHAREGRRVGLWRRSACGGVVCSSAALPWSRPSDAFDGYCFARWAIDETATDNVHWSYTRVPSCTFIRGLEPGPLPAATPPRPARYTDRAAPPPQERGATGEKEPRGSPQRGGDRAGGEWASRRAALNGVARDRPGLVSQGVGALTSAIAPRVESEEFNGGAAARRHRRYAPRQPCRRCTIGRSSGHCMCVRGAGRSRHGVNHRPARG